MKKVPATILALMFFCFFTVAAEEADPEEKSPDQHGPDMGRTYYDEGQDTIKSVYSYTEVQRFNPERPEEGVQIEEVKNGAYFEYYRNGRLKLMGTYNDGEKNGEFTYFTEDGKQEKIVIYEEGNKAEVVEND